MLSTRHGVRVLGTDDLADFLRLCAQDPVVNVFADHRARTTNLEPRWLGADLTAPPRSAASDRLPRATSPRC